MEWRMGHAPKSLQQLPIASRLLRSKASLDGGGVSWNRRKMLAWLEKGGRWLDALKTHGWRISPPPREVRGGSAQRGAVLCAPGQHLHRHRILLGAGMWFETRRGSSLPTTPRPGHSPLSKDRAIIFQKPITPLPTLGSFTTRGGGGLGPKWPKTKAIGQSPKVNLQWLCHWAGLSLRTAEGEGWKKVLAEPSGWGLGFNVHGKIILRALVTYRLRVIEK